MESSQPATPNTHPASDPQDLAAKKTPAATSPRRQAGADWANTNRARSATALRSASTNPVLPEMLHGLFWDCPFNDLRLPRDQPFVIGRVLTSGSWPQIGWLRQRVGDDGIRQWIGSCAGRPLDPLQLRFWELILDLPTQQVDRWLACRSPNVWDRRVGRKSGPRESDP